ncbi:hypothetical protein ACO0SA_004933 [Hanseniaspora valbyensis]
MDVLLNKFQIVDVETLKDDYTSENTFDYEELERVNFEEKFDALSDKKSNLIKNINSLNTILAKTNDFNGDLNSETIKNLTVVNLNGKLEQETKDADLTNIITPKEIEQILTDQVSPKWLALAFKILNERSSESLIQQILKNIILEKCKKILILTIKTLKTRETQLQAVHDKLFPISNITKIIYTYEPKQYNQFLELYTGCIHWYYKFYISMYTQALVNCRIETVVTVQEQATSYFSKFLSSASALTDPLGDDEYVKYEDHTNFKERLLAFQRTMNHVLPLQILESTNVVFKIEDIFKNFGLLLQDNYIKEANFVETFFNRSEIRNTDELYKQIEVFDDRFLFETCQNIFKNFIDSIEIDYLGILISIRLIQGYISDLESDSDLQRFWQELVQLQLWPKFQRITSLRIYQMDFLKNCDILKFYDFMKNLLFVDLYLNQKFQWNIEPIYQSFINGLNLFENINKNLKNEKGKQHWKILMFNLLDELDMDLRSKDIGLEESNIISELRQRYDI